MAIYPSGTLIANRYEVVQGPREKPSFAGGMGLVYLCVDHAETRPDTLLGVNGRPVALKTFRPELLPDRAARDRFLTREIDFEALPQLQHNCKISLDNIHFFHYITCSIPWETTCFWSFRNRNDRYDYGKSATALKIPVQKNF